MGKRRNVREEYKGTEILKKTSMKVNVAERKKKCNTEMTFGDFMSHSLHVHLHTRLHSSTDALLFPEKEKLYSKLKTHAFSKEKGGRDG